MRQPRIILVFHSTRMLLTLDLNTMVRLLLETFGQEIILQLRPMTDVEREAAEERNEVITFVRTRFLIKELREDGTEVRHEDLEGRMVHEGRK